MSDSVPPSTTPIGAGQVRNLPMTQNVAKDPFADIPDAPARFEGAEHRSIGDSIILDFNGTKVAAAETVLGSVGGVDLTFGKIIGLAGDFYTNMNFGVLHDSIGLPISWATDDADCAQRFNNAVKTMLDNKGEYIQKLQALLENEKQTIDGLNTSAYRDDYAEAYHDHFQEIPTDDEFNKATSNIGWGLAYKDYYAEIAWLNIDHFGPYARRAYVAGHKIALQRAADAGKSRSENGLKMAYFYEAFANHYLTDLFSSGHIRAQRSYLHDGGDSGDGTAALARSARAGLKNWPIWDLAVRSMHDDDSATGLQVTNSESPPKTWIAYGDKQFFNGHNRVNRYFAIEAIQAGADELAQAYAKPDQPLPTVDKFRALMKSPKPHEWEDLANAVLTGNSWPLWFLQTRTPQPMYWKPDVWYSTDWSRREHLNDHSWAGWKLSQSGTDSGYPGYHNQGYTSPSEDAVAVSKADWFTDPGKDAVRVNPQYPKTDFLEPLGGTFLQIREMARPNSAGSRQYRYDMVAWGPLVAEINGRQDNTYSLRTRYDAFLEYQGQGPNDTYNPCCLQWQSVPHDEKTISVVSIRLNLKGSGTNTSQLVCTSWPITMTNSGPDQMATVQEMANFAFDPKVTDFSDEELQPQVLPQDLPYVRVFINTMLDDSDSTNPAIATVRLLSDLQGGNQVYRLSLLKTSSGFKNADSVYYKDLVVPAEPKSEILRGYLKSINIRDGTTQGRLRNSSIVHIRAYFESDASKSWKISPTIIYRTGLRDFAVKKVLPQSAVLNYGAASDKVLREGDFSMLVGDLTGGNGPESFVLFGHKSYGGMWLNVGDYTSNAGQIALTTRQIPVKPSKQSTPVFQESDLLYPYMSALLPNEAGDGKDLALVMFQAFTQNGKNYTWIRTCFSKAGGQPLTSSVDCAVLDDLTSGMGDNLKFFKPISWLRTRIATKGITGNDGPVTENGVMQIFSWYGMLGCRVFAPRIPGKYDEWVLTGQTPMLGQTSIGTGYGFDGLWNQGMIPWGKDSSFVDITQLTNPVGNFQMTPNNKNRVKVYGTDVGARTKYEQPGW